MSLRITVECRRLLPGIAPFEAATQEWTSAFPTRASSHQPEALCAFWISLLSLSSSLSLYIFAIDLSSMCWILLLYFGFVNPIFKYFFIISRFLCSFQLKSPRNMMILSIFINNTRAACPGVFLYNKLLRLFIFIQPSAGRRSWYDRMRLPLRPADRHWMHG